MSSPPLKSSPAISGLPDFTFRQLEVFRIVCREGSFANAAIERRSTRGNIKRLCRDFERAMGRPLLDGDNGDPLSPTPFARELLELARPLTRALHRLRDTIQQEHAAGRIVRFAAADAFFQGGIFTDFLEHLKISDRFRPCFFCIEPTRFQSALLNAECDVYFGIGLTVSDRLDSVDLGPVNWRAESAGSPHTRLPDHPADLPADGWALACPGDPDRTTAIYDSLRQHGAPEGTILRAGESAARDGMIVLHADPTNRPVFIGDDSWPHFRFSAVLRKHHPYAELLPRLTGAALR